MDVSLGEIEPRRLDNGFSKTRFSPNQYCHSEHRPSFSLPTELFFVVAKFLEDGPCEKTAKVAQSLHWLEKPNRNLF